MKKINIKRAAASLIAVLVTLSLILPAFAAHTDIDKSWAKTDIEKWSSKGIINGYSDGTFRPNNNITRAEFVAIMTRLFGYIDKTASKFPDVKSSGWYYDYVAKAYDAGIIQGYSDGTFKPDQKISREQAAVIINRAFAFETVSKNEYSKFNDSAKISTWARDAVSSLTEKGIIQGRPGNVFDPLANITRAEVIHIVNKIAADLANKEGTYTGTINGTLIVNAKDVILKDMTISGDLYIAHGVGEGNVTLDNVTVSGKTHVYGGGMGTVRIKNSKLIQKVIVAKKNALVRLLAEGSTEIPQLFVLTGAKLEEKDIAEGKSGFSKVSLKSAAGFKTILAGIFDEVSIEGADAQQQGAKKNVQLQAGTVVKKLTAEAPVKIEGDGKIQNAVISANGVEIEKQPEQVVITKDGVTAVIEGKVVDKDTAGTPQQPGGGGGGPTVQYVTVSNIRMIINGNEVTDLNLSSKPGTDRFSGVRFTTNVAQSEFQITAVETQKTGRLTADSKHSFTGTEIELSVQQLLGSGYSGQTDVSLETLRTLAGNYIKIEGVLKGTGPYASYVQFTTPIIINLTTGTSVVGKLTDYMAINYDSTSKILTATVAGDKENIQISNYKNKLEDIIEDIIGFVPYYVTDIPASIQYFNPHVYLYNPDTYSGPKPNPPYLSLSQKGDFKTALEDKYAPKTYSISTSKFGDLRGIEFYIKRGDTNQVYTIKIQ